LPDLDEGEVALNLADGAIYSRDGSNNIVRFGVIEGTGANNNVARHDGTKWVVASGVSLTSGGDLGLGTGDVITSGNIVGGAFAGDGSLLTSVDAATLQGLDAGDFVEDGASGAYDIGGVLYRDSVAVHTGFKRFRVLDQATYDGLTPDADTLYFITA